MRIDVVSIFPDYLAPLELSLAGRARAARPARRARPRPAGVDPRPAPHRRRHPVRRRSRDGHEARALGRGARRRAHARRDAGRPDPRRRAVHAGGRPRAGRPRAPGRRLRALRGHRPAGPRPLRRHPRRPRALDRRLRPQRGRGRGVGGRRGGRPAAPGLHGQRGVAAGGVPRGRAARVPRLHQARQLARPRRTPGAAVGRPRGDRGVAPPPVPRPDGGATPGPAAAPRPCPERRRSGARSPPTPARS